MSDAASVAVRSARGSLARDGVGFGVAGLDGCCWTRLGLDEEGGLCFPSFLNTEKNFGDMNFCMMFQNREPEQ